MDVTERINLLIGHCREAQYPDVLTNALCAYLSGEGSLAQVQQEWQAHPLQDPPFPPSFSALSGDHVDGLDELDQRRLNICIATSHLDEILESLVDDSPIEPLFHYLQKQQGQQQKILEYLIACYDWMRNDKPTPLGRLLLCYLPEHFPAMLPLMKQNRWDSEYPEFLELLASAQPPYADLAWQTVQQVSPGDLGDCVEPLLKADPPRFREWARQVASPNGPGDESDQVDALLALFDCDFANNIDLAVAIASGSRTFSNRWNGRRAQQSALTAVYRSNPSQYLYLVEEAVVSKEYYLYDTALDLLEEANQESARPVLQHAVEAGAVPAAVRAAKRLHQAEWDGRQDYTLSLLPHRSKQVRDVAIDWLLPQGETLIEQVSPLLAKTSAYARLAAVEILARLGGERAHALLAGQLEIEKSVSVKQAIVDAIGLPEPPDDLDPTTAIAALLAEASSGGKKSPLCWFVAEESTGLRWVNGAAVPPSVIYYLLTCQARMRQMQLEMSVRRILQWLDRQTTGALALTLFTGWVKQGGNAKESWCLPLIAALGDDRLVQFLRRQIDTLGRKSRRRALGIKTVQTLALIGSDLALTEVSDLARHAKNDQIQQAAREAFAEAASRQNLSQEELADRIAPRLGFNEQGEQTLDYGPRQFTARLGFDLTVYLKDSSGKRLTLLPRANARDDAAKVAAAQGAWQVLKKHLASAAKIQAERMENALSTQRAWSVARWRELFLQHPLLRSFAINLVWGTLNADRSGYETIFRPLEDGSLTNADDDACALPGEGFVRMVHPIELDEETRSAWLQHLADYEITPPFPQLNRPTIAPDEAKREGIWWDEYQGYRVAGKLIKERYQRSGWEPGENERGESYNLIWKAFPAAGIEALLEISYLMVGYERSWPTTIIRLGFGRAGTVERIRQATAAAAESDDNDAYDYYHPHKIDEAALLKLADVPPVVFSEAAANVQVFAALGHYDADWQKKTEEDPDDDNIPYLKRGGIMQATERIEAIAKVCRVHYNSFPETLINAMCQYLAGQGSLAQINQEWKAAGNITAYPYHRGRFIMLSETSSERLDELDLRLLDICVATDIIGEFFSKIAESGPVTQARDYLLAQGVTEADIVKALIDCYNFVRKDEHDVMAPTALGQLLLAYIPGQFEEILKNLPQGTWSPARQTLSTLLLNTRPESYLDMIWQIAQKADPYQADIFTAELLKADPARFTEWARQVAKTSIQHHPQYQHPTLEALLELDPAQHIDLAIEAAHVPLGKYRWNHAELQRTGLGAAYRLDPAKYLSLVEEAVVAPNSHLGKYAVELLQSANFEQARPILQRCIASGDTEAALKALDVLLEHQWAERQAYMLSLIPHRSKQMRDALIKWLVKDGESIVEPLAPYLAHSNGDARLAAVQALQRIGRDQARALLAARLDVEKSLKVKQAILDVVGVATLADTSESPSASPVEALTAEAEAALKRVAKSALLWFDPARMPTPRWKDGAPVPPVVLNYLLYRQSRVKHSKLDERVEQALLLLDRGRLGDLALAQFNGWIGHGAKSEQAWCLPLVCALADERLILPLRQYIDGWVKTARGALAAKAVVAMALIESDLALAEINDLAERVKHSQVKKAAQTALTDAAEHRHITLEELSDLIVPALGFDEKGERLFDYGPRQFTVRLHLDQTLQITDSAGKRVATLPRPNARDDESKAKAALAAWSLLKKQVPQVIKMHVQRLGNALINQRSWSVARWQSLFLKHPDPLLRSFVISLVWGVVTPGQAEYQALFRPLEDGSLTDAEDNAVTLPAEGTIRMAHPVELDEAARAAWLQHLADYEVTPPFPQLNRPIACVSADEREALWWEKYKGYVMNGAALKGRYMKAGWERGSVQDSGVYHTIWKAFPAAGIQAVLETAGLGVGFEQEFSTAIKRLAFARIDTIKRGSYVYDDLKEQDERIIKLGDVPPIVFSEAAVDVQAFAAAGEYAEDWERKVW